MEENFCMEWKIFGMEWKRIASMEYGKIVFHSIPCPDGCKDLIAVFDCHEAKMLKSNFPILRPLFIK